MTKKYDPATAKEIIAKSKKMQLDTTDERMQNLPAGVPFERSSIKYNILESLQTGVHSKTTIEFGGYEFSMRLLSTKELRDIDVKVRNLVLNDKSILPEHEDNMRGVFILEKALTSCPEASDGILNANDIDSLDLNYLLGLLDEYRAFVAKCDLSIDNMTDEQFGEVVELIRGKQIHPRDLSHRLLVKVTIFFAGYLDAITQPKDNSPTPQ